MKARRVELGPSKPFAVNGNTEKSSPSIRLNLKLCSTTTNSFPEFSYAELLQNALDEKENPFAAKDREEHDKLVDIAKRFEEKYNKQSTTWEKGQKTEKRRERDEDMIDMGAGYDLSDSFVDDSELYDELVPQCCTPQHGGFYINSGKLEMIVSDDSDSDLFDPQLIKKKRKKISLSQNWIDDSQDKNTDITPATSDDGLAKKKKRLGSVGNGHVESTREGGYVKTRDLDPTTWSDLELTSSSDEEAGDGSEPPKKVYATSEGMDEAIQSVLQQSVHYVTPKYASRLGINGDAGEDGSGRSVDNSRSPDVKAALAKRLASVDDSVAGSPDVRQITSADEDGGQPSETDTKRPPPVLPDNLPASLVSAMDKLKEAAAQRQEGKCKFFTPYVNSLLLEVENQRVRLPRGAKMVIYDYLESFLPCGKMTLIKRSKALRENSVQETVDNSLHRLKEAIERVMPEQLAQYDVKLAAATTAYQNKLKAAGSGDGGNGAESVTQFKAPNRKFIFNDEIRRLLENIVLGWMESYTLNSSSGEGQTAEEYLTECIRTELIKLWPSPWMRIKILYNLTESVHQRWTDRKQEGEADKVIKKRGRQPKSVSSETQNMGKLMMEKIEREMENDKSGHTAASLPPTTTTTCAKVDVIDATLAPSASVSVAKLHRQSTDTAESDLRELTVTGLASTVDFVTEQQHLGGSSSLQCASSELDKLAETLRSLSDDFPPPAPADHQQPAAKRPQHSNKLSLSSTSAHYSNTLQPAATDVGSQMSGGRGGSTVSHILYQQLTQQSDRSLSSQAPDANLPSSTTQPSSSMPLNLGSKLSPPQSKKMQMLSHLQAPMSTTQHQPVIPSDVTPKISLSSSASLSLTGTGYGTTQALMSSSLAHVSVSDTIARNNVRRSLPLGTSQTPQQSGSLNDVMETIIGKGLVADRQASVTITSRSQQSAVSNTGVNAMKMNTFQQAQTSLPAQQQQLSLDADFGAIAHSTSSASRKNSTHLTADYASASIGGMQQTNNAAAMSADRMNQYLVAAQQQQHLQKLQASWPTVQESPPKHQQRSPIASSAASMIGTYGGSVLTNRRPSMSSSDSAAYLHTYQDPGLAQLHFQNSTDMYLASSGVSPSRSANRLPTYVPSSPDLHLPAGGNNMFVPGGGGGELMFDHSLSSNFRPTDQQNSFAQLQAALAAQQAMLQSPHGLAQPRFRYDSPF